MDRFQFSSLSSPSSSSSLLKEVFVLCIFIFISVQDHHSLDADSTALQALQGYISSDNDAVYLDEASMVSLKTLPIYFVILKRSPAGLLQRWTFLVFYIVLNNIFYPVQERDHHSRDVLSAGGEGAQVPDQMNPLVNQHENLDMEFNSIEDMVSIPFYLEPNILVLDLDSTTNFHSIHFQYNKRKTAKA